MVCFLCEFFWFRFNVIRIVCDFVYLDVYFYLLYIIVCEFFFFIIIIFKLLFIIIIYLFIYFFIYGLDFLRKRGYQPTATPLFMNQSVMAKTAQLSDFDEQLYKVTGHGEDKVKKLFEVQFEAQFEMGI
jgi:hypothetical protein